MTKRANSSMRQVGRSRSKSIPIAIFNTYDFLSGDAEGVVSILGGCEHEIQRGGSICGGVDEGLQTTCTVRV